MAFLYLTEQGAVLKKTGERLLVVPVSPGPIAACFASRPNACDRPCSPAVPMNRMLFPGNEGWQGAGRKDPFSSLTFFAGQTPCSMLSVMISGMTGGGCR